jgi:hypothetical protein
MHSCHPAIERTGQGEERFGRDFGETSTAAGCEGGSSGKSAAVESGRRKRWDEWRRTGCCVEWPGSESGRCFEFVAGGDNSKHGQRNGEREFSIHQHIKQSVE